jgi:hypothetical protein
VLKLQVFNHHASDIRISRFCFIVFFCLIVDFPNFWTTLVQGGPKVREILVSEDVAAPGVCNGCP